MKEPSMIPEHILWVFWHMQAEITSLNLRSNQLIVLNLLRSASTDSEGKIPFWDFTKNFFPHISFSLMCCMTHSSHPPWFITPVICAEHFPPLTHEYYSCHPVLELLQSKPVPQLRTSCAFWKSQKPLLSPPAWCRLTRSKSYPSWQQ